MDLVPLHRSEIQVGREAPYDIFDLHGNKLLSKGVLIASESVWERVLERGWRDGGGEGASGARRAEREAPPPPPTVFEKVEAFSGELGLLHDAVVGGRAPDAGAAIDDLAGRVLACFEADQDAMLAALQIGAATDSASSRMLHVCVLAELMTDRLGLDPAMRRAIRAATLSYDLGMHALDRKSTRLNSSHVKISYAVFCLKKKKQ